MKKQKFNKLDKVLILLALFLFVFIVATVAIYTVNGWQYDALITCVLGAGGVEAIAGAFIQIAKYKHKVNDSDSDSDDNEESEVAG